MSHHDLCAITGFALCMLQMGCNVAQVITHRREDSRGASQWLTWLVGSSAFAPRLSARSFTGAASKAYRWSRPMLEVFCGKHLGFTLNAFYFSLRARRIRVLTTLVFLITTLLYGHRAANAVDFGQGFFLILFTFVAACLFLRVLGVAIAFFERLSAVRVDASTALTSSLSFAFCGGVILVVSSGFRHSA